MALVDVAAPHAGDANYTGVVPKGAREVPNEPVDVPPPTEGPTPPRNGRKPAQATTAAFYDLEAEYHLLAELTYQQHAIPDALTLLHPADLTDTGAAILHAIADLAATGEQFDSANVAQRVGKPDIVGLFNTHSTGAWKPHARHLADLARRRRLHHAGTELAQAAADGNDERADYWTDQLTRAPSTTVDALPHEPLAQFLDTDEPGHDWVIDGLLERGDRVLLTGPEGGGKSTLLRQIAVQAAAGIHPFTLDDIDPLTVVLIDLENSTRFLRRMLRPLDAAAAQQAGANLHIVSHPQGLDLTDPDDRRAFTALIDQVQPDLLLGGPVYKLVGGDPTEEGPAKAAATLLDQLRVRHGFALALETHQPHENGGKRPERPYGASLWKRWPEFGLHLADRTYELRHWRGDRDQRAWPAALQRGGEWPWTVASDGTLTFARLCDEVRQAGRMLSLRELGDRLGASKSWVARTIEANRNEWAALESAL